MAVDTWVDDDDGADISGSGLRERHGEIHHRQRVIDKEKNDWKRRNNATWLIWFDLRYEVL